MSVARSPLPHHSTRTTRAVSAITRALGSTPVIVMSVVVVVAWLVGAMFVVGGFANQLYELILNTITNIAAFIMVFIIQSSQNRDSDAIQTKMDAQIKVLRDIADRLGISEASELDEVVGLEEAPERSILDTHRRIRG